MSRGGDGGSGAAGKDYNLCFSTCIFCFYFFGLRRSIRAKSASQRSDASDGARSRGGGNPCLIVAVAPAASI